MNRPTQRQIRKAWQEIKEEKTRGVQRLPGAPNLPRQAVSMTRGVMRLRGSGVLSLRK